MTHHLRTATLDDVAAIDAVMARAARGLSAGYYTPAQIDGLIRQVFTADTQLLRDGTYFVIETDGAIVAAGGWSRRGTLYGGDHHHGQGHDPHHHATGADDPPLDPATDAARIRAFFVAPEAARRGLGRRLYEACRRDALAAGFRAFELVATLPGEPLYRALGFVPGERVVVTLADGLTVDARHMHRAIAP